MSDDRDTGRNPWYQERKYRRQGFIQGVATTVVVMTAVGGMIALVLFGLHH